MFLTTYFLMAPKLTQKKLRDVDWAWLAGFIDGEGYIGIVRHRKRADSQQSDTWQYHPWVIVTNTDISILDYLESVVSSQKRAPLGRTAGHKLGYQVKVSKFKEVTRLLTGVYPFLRMKKKQAELLMKFCELRNGVKIITGRGSRGSSSFGENEEKIYLQLRKLNKRGI